MTATRKTTLSARKLANVGDTYRQTWIGKRAVFTTWEGQRIEGTITGFKDGTYPVVTFDDGRWARLDLEVELVA